MDKSNHVTVLPYYTIITRNSTQFLFKSFSYVALKLKYNSVQITETNQFSIKGKNRYKVGGIGLKVQRDDNK